MSATKLSISLETDLISAVREAAAADGVSVSTWLADAARAKARRRSLREALDAFARERGAPEPAEIDAIVSTARRGSAVSHPRKKRSA